MPIDFNCPHCQKKYRLDDATAGKLVKCKQCAKPIRVPGPTASMPAAPAVPVPRAYATAAAPPVPVSKRPVFDDAPVVDEYDLKDSPKSYAAAPATSANGCPSCHAPIQPGAMICVSCGLNFKTGEKLGTQKAVGASASLLNYQAPAAFDHLAEERRLAGRAAIALGVFALLGMALMGCAGIAGGAAISASASAGGRGGAGLGAVIATVLIAIAAVFGILGTLYIIGGVAVRRGSYAWAVTLLILGGLHECLVILGVISNILQANFIGIGISGLFFLGIGAMLMKLFAIVRSR